MFPGDIVSQLYAVAFFAVCIFAVVATKQFGQCEAVTTSLSLALCQLKGKVNIEISNIKFPPYIWK